MYYVYSRHIDSGREDYCGCYNTMKEAVAKIRRCYNIDMHLFTVIFCCSAASRDAVANVQLVLQD